MYCNNNLILELKQGEDRTFGFTIVQNINNNEVPLDLTGYNIKVEVRQQPYSQVTPFINKLLDTTETIDGYIYNPTGGQFQIRFNDIDFNGYPPNDYYLSVYIINDDTNSDDPTIVNISGNGNNTSIIRFCKC